MNWPLKDYSKEAHVPMSIAHDMCRRSVESHAARIAKLEAALQAAATRFNLLAAHDDTIRNGVKPSAGYADCIAALKPSN